MKALPGTGSSSGRFPDLRWHAVAAVLLAGSVDLGWSAAAGQHWVRPAWPRPPLLPAAGFLTAEILVLTGVLAAVGLTACLAGRLIPAARRMPWTLTLGPALALLVVWRELGAPRLWLLAVVAAAIATSALVEHRRPLPSPGPRSVGLCLAILLASFAAGLLLPTRELARVPAPPAASRTPEERAGPNLLLIVLDTVRADHLTMYGYPRQTMPFLAEMAKKATVFEHAVASSSYTLPSHATLFTGLHPRRHGARISPRGVSLFELGRLEDATRVGVLSPEAVTLAELARAQGLETGAVSANLAYLSPVFGLDQGFDAYLPDMDRWRYGQPAAIAVGRTLLERLGPAEWASWYRSRVTAGSRFYLLASEVNALALRWLGHRRDHRFLLFLNYMDAHAPYRPRRGYRELYPSSDAPQLVDRQAILSGRRGILPEERSAMVDAYDAELRYLDDQLRLLFAGLEECGLLRETVVIVTGDHGESFGEHGELGHASGLHEPQLHVPLLLRLPGQTAGRRVGRAVQLADVMPTVVELLGLDPPMAPLDGSSLLTGADAPATAHLGPYGGVPGGDAIYHHGLKLVVEGGGGPSHLFDFRHDPEELHDLASERRGEVAALRTRLEDLAGVDRPGLDPGEPALDENTRARLRALGYVP